jgi:hypothetical protein
MNATDVSQMSAADRIGEAFERSLPLLPASARDEIAKLIRPQTLAVVAGVLTAWVISHFFGVGEIVDAILIGAGVLAIGLAVFDGIDELYEFAKGALAAKSYEELNAAAKHFARAVAILGIQAVLAVLLKGSPKTFRGGRVTVGPAPAFARGSGFNPFAPVHPRTRGWRWGNRHLGRDSDFTPRHRCRSPARRAA